MSELWRHDSGYGAKGPKVPYLTDEQNERHERIRVARMLWQGKHRLAFLEEGRTQWDFTRLRAQGATITPYVTCNLLKLVTTTITDLLVGQEPAIRVDDKALQQNVDDLVNRCDLHSVFYEAAKTASWASEAMVEVTIWDGQVYIQEVIADEMYPLGVRNPDGQYSAYRRYAVETVQDGTATMTLLLETTYRAGSIERICYKLDGSKRQSEVGLSRWPVKRPDGSDLLDTEATRIDWPTIVWMANELDEGKPTCDYDGLIALQDAINHKFTQVARVLAKHSDPKMAIPESMVDPVTGDISARHDVFFMQPGGQKPEYLTWNAELGPAVVDRDSYMHAFCMAAELSPVLMGIQRGATPDAIEKLKLEATKSLSRTHRKGTRFRPFVRTAVDTALKMEQAWRRVSVALKPSAVDLRDGLPVDEKAEAETLMLMTGGKAIMPVEEAVERRLTDPEAVATAMERLAAEAEAAMPTVLLGNGNGLEAGETSNNNAGALPVNDVTAGESGQENLNG